MILKFMNGKASVLGAKYEGEAAEYSGEWRDDVLSGQGTITYSTESVYSGAFLDGNRHGAPASIDASTVESRGT